MQLQEGETIIGIVRQHWFVMVQPIFVSAIIVAMLATAGLYLQFDFFGYSNMVYLAMCPILLLFLLYKFYLWRNNNLMITNFRIINNEQRGLFSQTVTELLYRDITDVSFTQDGPSAMSFNYGTLIIRLPSQDQIKIEMISKPSMVIEIINRVRMGSFVN